MEKVMLSAMVVYLMAFAASLGFILLALFMVVVSITSDPQLTVDSACTLWQGAHPTRGDDCG